MHFDTKKIALIAYCWLLLCQSHRLSSQGGTYTYQETSNLVGLVNDAGGKFLFHEFVQVVQERGSGWVDYLWPRPGTTTPLPKTSFVGKVVGKGETFVVGTGICPE